MYTIREIDYKRDTSRIVALLKEEFGNRFTEAFFVWKHLQNPFGKSFGLVAVDENGQVIGVRLFLWWQFKKEDQIIIAIRPVDTTTDKRYRGMGIFKKLTLTGIDQLSGRYEFIFNTPNNNSLPGYLKMGWKRKSPDIQYYLNFVNPFFSYEKFEIIQKFKHTPNTFQTRYTTLKYLDFLNWRYRDDAYKKALFTEGNSDSAIIYKIIEKKVSVLSLKMILIIDIIGINNRLSASIKSICKKEGCLCYYFAETSETKNLKNPFSIKRGTSVVAFRMSDEAFLNKIVFSAGDLEGIL